MLKLKEKFAPICVTAAAVCVLALAGCGNSDGLTGGVAATVNGTDIAEDKVTAYIEDFRASAGATAEKDWAEYLDSMGYTPETLREAIVDMFVTQELEKQEAAKANVEVTDDEVNKVVASMRANYDSDEAWEEALSSANLTEESYRENIYMPMLEEKLIDAVVDEKDAKADDETVLGYVQMYAPALDGMKRSSHILFAADDKKKAQEVLDQLNNGGDFEKLAKENSTDSGSAKNGGDVGWSGLNSFVDAYTEALDKLEKGETSGLVTSEYGIHIIRCTDVWNAPEEIKSLKDVPEDLVDVVRTQMADPQAKQAAFSKYLEDLRDKADVHVNELPSDASYNVDMEKYAKSDDGDDADDDADADADADDADADEEADEDAEDGEEVVIDGDDIEIVEEDADDAGDDAAEGEGDEADAEASDE